MRHTINIRSTALLDAPFGAYEQHLLRHYALAMFLPEKAKARQPIEDTLIDWYQANRAMLAFRVSALDAVLRDGRKARDYSGQFMLRYAGKLPAIHAASPPPSALQKRLEWAAATLGLSPVGTTFLGAVVRMTYVPAFREFYTAATDITRSDDEVNGGVIARMAGLTPREGWRLFDHRSPLLQLGLVEDRGAGDVAVSSTLVDLLATPSTDPDVLRRSLLGDDMPTELALADFDHLGSARDIVLTLVDSALTKRDKGASLLLYGAPGTGKTEFAKLIAAELEADVVFIGERRAKADERGYRAEPSRADRLSHLAFASALAERAGRVVLVIDEADEVFVGVDDDRVSERAGSKVFINRMLERCPVPMIWITNHPRRLGDAVLRRMLYAAEFRDADRPTRRRIAARHASERGLALPSRQLDELASLSASPALLGTGIRAAALAAKQGKEAGDLAITVTRSLLRVAGRAMPSAATFGPLEFDVSLSNADIDLVQLEHRVVAAGPGALSFLFAGLPGTGKSAFARHLSNKLGLEVLEKRGSDLLGMYVGETEKAIARAFEEAADARRFLIFDEVDSLLADRAGAQRSWEVSQVNEMLTWMERHPAPFAATTNLATRLDPATQRRFLFKATFEALSSAQANAAFQRAFGAAAPPLVARLPQLTPGDFAVVSRKASVLGVTEPETLAQMLEREVLAKPRVRHKIGF